MIITTNEILAAITVIGAIVGGLMFFRRPQEELDKRQSVSETEVQGKATALAQQVQWEKEANEKKFIEMGNSIKDAFLLAQNHTHTVDVKVDRLIESVNALDKGMTELRTIINERIPKK